MPYTSCAFGLDQRFCWCGSPRQGWPWATFCREGLFDAPTTKWCLAEFMKTPWLKPKKHELEVEDDPITATIERKVTKEGKRARGFTEDIHRANAETKAWTPIWRIWKGWQEKA